MDAPLDDRAPEGAVDGSVLPGTSPGRGARAFALAFSALFLVPHVVVVVAGRESYPWTCAPMFAHHLTRGEMRYAFRYVVEGPEGGRGLDYDDLGLAARRSWRFFFAYVYGSAERGYPVHEVGPDAPADFARRVGDHMRDVLVLARRTVPRRVAGATALRLEIDHHAADGRVVATTVVGRFDIAADSFVHDPEPPR